ERGRDDLGAAVVAVLADLGDQEARAATMLPHEALDLSAHRRPVGVVGEVPAVDARNGADGRLVPPPDLLERFRDLAHGGPGARRLHRQGEEIALPALRAAL